MMTQFGDAQPDRDGETGAHHRDSDDRGSDRPDVDTGLAAATTPPPSGCRRRDRDGYGANRTAYLPEDSGRRRPPNW